MKRLISTSIISVTFLVSTLANAQDPAATPPSPPPAVQPAPPPVVTTQPSPPAAQSVPQPAPPPVVTTQPAPPTAQPVPPSTPVAPAPPPNSYSHSTTIVVPQPVQQQQPEASPPQAYPPPPYAAPPPPQPQSYPVVPPPPKKRRKGLMIAGWTLLGTSYLITALAGSITYDICRDGGDASCRRAGAYLMIPVAGPVIAMSEAEVRTPLVFPFVIQTTGLIMGIVGTSMYVRDGRQNQFVNAEGVRLAKGLRVNAGSTPRLDGASLNFNYRF